MKERIEKLRLEEIENLNKKDPLNFLGKDEDKEEQQFYNMNMEDYDLYGISAPFLKYLTNKISLSKERKGRGILISCNKFNEEQRLVRLVGLLKLGLNITLVSDAGTPTISDPGYQFVSKCINNNIDVFSIPGPCSVSVALSLSGFPADRYQFLGFLPRQQTEREIMLSDARNYKQSTVLFESAQRLADLFISIEKVYGSLQQVWIGFELTKLFEKKLRGECRELYEELHNPKLHKHLKGEVILIIAPYTRDYNINLVEETPKVETEYNQKIDMINAAQVLSNQLDCSNQELAELLQKILKVSKNKAYKLVVRVRHDEEIQKNRAIMRKKMGVDDDILFNE